MTAAIPPGLIVAAPASGSGKTTVTLGLLRAFARRGLRVQPFKTGPDYIDPGFHAAAAGTTSVNLDSWAMTGDTIAGLVGRATGADLVLAEGAMGLFDGVAVPGLAGTGAAADIAALTGWPVVLVINVTGQAQSAAAVAQGFARHRAGVRVAGVILNRCASPRHEAMVRDGMAAVGITVFGALPRQQALALPERHLGLVQAQESAGLDGVIDGLADLVAAHVDLAALRAAADGAMRVSSPVRISPPGQRIALAQDAAFSFVYPHLVDGWRAAGAEILPFSPLADQAPDGSADVAWLPGGYPELHAGRLAAATNFRDGLRRFADTRPVHGECGGYMAMGEALVDADGVRHGMAGLLGLVTSFATRRLAMGYRRARLLHGIPGHPAGAILRGHEFHYSTIQEGSDQPLAEISDSNGTILPDTGSRRGLATGTYFHLIGPDG